VDCKNVIRHGPKREEKEKKREEIGERKYREV
jgi:hypothetical protein